MARASIRAPQWLAPIETAPWQTDHPWRDLTFVVVIAAAVTRAMLNLLRRNLLTRRRRTIRASLLHAGIILGILIVLTRDCAAPYALLAQQPGVAQAGALGAAQGAMRSSAGSAVEGGEAGSGVGARSADCEPIRAVALVPAMIEGGGNG